MHLDQIEHVYIYMFIYIHTLYPLKTSIQDKRIHIRTHTFTYAYTYANAYAYTYAYRGKAWNPRSFKEPSVLPSNIQVLPSNIQVGLGVITSCGQMKDVVTLIFVVVYKWGFNSLNSLK